MTVFECGACSHRAFPKRLLCPRCGGAQFRAIAAEFGLLEEVTTSSAGDTIASVRTEAGPLVLAGLDRPLATGSRVRLTRRPGLFAAAAPCEGTA